MEQMRDAWLAFAAAGNPNHPGLPAWRPYTAQEKACMVFDTPCACRDAHDAALLDLLEN